jgi:hypothetical protein
LFCGGTFVINIQPLEIRELPANKLCQTPGTTVCLAKGVTDMHAETKSPTSNVEVSGPKAPKELYPSTSYQKILDYRVAEILLTILFGIAVLLRLRH